MDLSHRLETISSLGAESCVSDQPSIAYREALDKLHN